jgi:hypothetical protein
MRALLEPMLAGGTPGTVPEDDRRLAVDLGLVRRSESGGWSRERRRALG